MTMRFASILAISAAALFFTTSSAEAQSISPVYKVQVEYWFFDTDYYYWSTKLETTDYQEALDYLETLQDAQDAGMLNSVVPNSYWRYIAVDVRMTVTYPIMQVNYNYYQPYRYFSPLSRTALNP